MADNNLDPGFEEVSLDAGFAPVDLAPQGSGGGAKGAFEAGNPRASFYPDTAAQTLRNGKSTGPGEGPQQYANPVSGSAAFAAGGLRGATEVPFAGNLAGRAITSATGTSLDEFKTFEEAAAEQHPIASAAGELTGALGLGPKLVEGAAKGFTASARGLGQILKAGTELASGKAIQYGAKAAKYFVGGGLGKTASLLMDRAALGNPKVVAKNLAELRPVMDSLNATIEESANAVGDILPDVYKHNTSQLKSLVETQVMGDVAQGAKPASYTKRVGRVLNDWIASKGEKVWTTSDKLSLARQMDEEARTFAGRLATRTELSNGQILSDSARALRDSVAHDITQAATVSGDSSLVTKFQAANEDYSKLAKTRDILSSALRNHKKQEMVDAGLQRTAELLGKGEALGKFYKQLMSAAKYGLPAATRVHTNLIANNPDYRALLDQLDAQGGQ